MIRSRSRQQVDLANKKIRIVFLVLSIFFITIGITLLILGLRDMSDEDYFGPSPLLIISIPLLFSGIFFGIMTILAFVIVSSKKKTAKQTNANMQEDDFGNDKEKDGVECNYCHHINQPGSVYCSKCGEKIIRKVICPNCKAQNDSDSSYCYRCGHRL